jgi:hypothetical protein
MSSICKISIPTAARMLANYATMNGMSGNDLISVFDAGMLSARVLNPSILGRNMVMNQDYDDDQDFDALASELVQCAAAEPG